MQNKMEQTRTITMQQLNDKERTILLTNLGIKNAKGLPEGRRKYLRKQPKGNTLTSIANPHTSHTRRPLGVLCITTGETFTSINATARAHNISAGNLCDHLKGKHHTIGGKKYEYITDNTNQ